jgi:hypothetical protein
MGRETRRSAGDRPGAATGRRKRPPGAGPFAWPGPADVVHARAGVARFALDHIGDRGLLEHVASRLGGIAEDALGVATEGSIEQLHDLEHGHLRWVAREAVAALHPALRADHAGTAQHREQLLEELHRHLAPARQLADRNRT